MTEQVTNARLKVDALMNLTSGLTGSPEITKALNGLKMGKGWLGKFRGVLGEETPYKKDGERKTVDDIEKTNDVAEVSVNFNDGTLGHIEKVDIIRQEIEKVLKEHIKPIVNDNEARYSMALVDDAQAESGYLELDNVITHLSEARMWLGFELQRIKDADNKA